MRSDLVRAPHDRLGVLNLARPVEDVAERDEQRPLVDRFDDRSVVRDDDDLELRLSLVLVANRGEIAGLVDDAVPARVDRSFEIGIVVQRFDVFHRGIHSLHEKGLTGVRRFRRLCAVGGAVVPVGIEIARAANPPPAHQAMSATLSGRCSMPARPRLSFRLPSRV